MTTPPRRVANSRASADLPDAVAPAMRIGAGARIDMLSTYAAGATDARGGAIEAAEGWLQAVGRRRRSGAGKRFQRGTIPDLDIAAARYDPAATLHLVQLPAHHLARSAKLGGNLLVRER